jgi:hypothetical protein
VAVATDAASEAATATDKTLYLLYFISSPLNLFQVIKYTLFVVIVFTKFKKKYICSILTTI